MLMRVLTVAVSLWAAGGVVAADPPALKGTWTHTAGEFTINMAFGKNIADITVLVGDNGAVLTCDYTAEKDGTLKLKVTKVVEKGSFPGKPPVGQAVSFKWKVDGKKATLSDFNGEGVEEARNLMEGDYTLVTTK